MFSKYPTDDAGLNYYTCVTLIDITKTDAVRHFQKGTNEIETVYNIKRNQQRNYQTFLQVIGLRCQTMFLSDPILYADQFLAEFGVQYTFNRGDVWSFNFGVEAVDVFDLENRPYGVLLDDLHNVPIVTGLNETVVIETAMIDTANDKTRNTLIFQMG